MNTATNVEQATWRLAAIELGALVCAACKCGTCASGERCRMHAFPSKHQTCAKVLRLARKFNARAAGQTYEDQKKE